MKKIFKYQIDTTDEQSIEMPDSAEILTVQTQNNIPFIWAIINTESPKAKFTLRIFGTGHLIPNDFNGKYIGTYQLDFGGILVFHVFQL